MQPWIEDQAVHRAVAIVDRDETVIRLGPGVQREATFAIGSITKTMVATVLASLHLADGLNLDTPIGELLDVPANGDITLRQLVTHTSGLPRMAPNAMEHPGFRIDDPHAAYSAELALAGLASVERTATSTTDTVASYSNYGFQLLGLALEAASGVGLPTLLRERIFEPLNMAGAFHRLAEPARPQVTGRHRGYAVPRWQLLLGGPGGVECSIADAALWARAVARPTADPVGRAVALAADLNAPLAWMPSSQQGWLWHDGGEAGAQTMILASPDTGRAAIALAAARPDGLRNALVYAVRGLEPPTPPQPPADDDPRWTLLERAVELLRSRDIDALTAILTPTYRDSPSVAALPDEIADVGPIDSAPPERLSGQPLAVTAKLHQHPDKRLLVVLDEQDEFIGGFTTYPADVAPPW